MIATVVNSIFALLFLLFAYVNINDGDGWLWILIYFSTAVVCGMAAFKMVYPMINIALIVLFSIYAGYLFFTKDGVLDWITEYQTPSLTESMQATKPYIERTREFFGLLIAIAVLSVNFFTRKRF